ncbi:NADH dehydrogenase [ubiquinone] 1 alpha subcomplex assembly factor 2-like [Mya arenaria]|uniref:NADH dehydrogenase [ubiquinone] 1 alpha subcomplex assembly factor 2-like n=1 Tax=Mya arenaria TaxID=6604 RepID=UPI0022E1FBEF|nr:NADH dehydrogenase [ubiquinone] 1 alpha subcomplex assembly factor 2-like [Mya arenaria]
MSRRTNVGVIKTLWNYFTKFRPAIQKAEERCVGIDKHGNKYMIRLANPEAMIKEQRFIVPVMNQDEDYAEINEAVSIATANIPPEWNAWLRQTRKEPPNDKEIELNRLKQMKVLDRARELEAKHRLSLEQTEPEMLEGSSQPFGTNASPGETLQGDPTKQRYPVREGLEVMPGMTQDDSDLDNEKETKHKFKD